MTNSGAPGGLPMTHHAGGEFHGPLGHASSDLSEIASRKQNFWGISRPSGCVSGISRALSRPRSHRKRSDKGSQRSPGRRVDARSIGQRFRALAALSGPVRHRKMTLDLLTQHTCCLILDLPTKSQFHTAKRSGIVQKRSVCAPGTHPVPLRGPGITFWEWLILCPKSGRLDHCVRSGVHRIHNLHRLHVETN